MKVRVEKNQSIWAMGMFNTADIVGKEFDVVGFGYSKQTVPFGPSNDPLFLESDVVWLNCDGKLRGVPIKLVTIVEN